MSQRVVNGYWSRNRVMAWMDFSCFVESTVPRQTKTPLEADRRGVAFLCTKRNSCICNRRFTKTSRFLPRQHQWVVTIKTCTSLFAAASGHYIQDMKSKVEFWAVKRSLDQGDWTQNPVIFPSLISSFFHVYFGHPVNGAQHVSLTGGPQQWRRASRKEGGRNFYSSLAAKKKDLLCPSFLFFRAAKQLHTPT